LDFEMNAPFGILLVLTALAILFAALKLLERWLHPHPELLRKLLHVGMGLVVISFPWVFQQRWPVLLLAGVSAVLMAAVKHIPRLRAGIGSVVTGVNRPSLGEVCFPAAVASLCLLSRGDKLLFVVPMLIMTLADAVAALVGLAYGRVRYVTSDGFKSAEGSIAFFAIAFLSVHVPLLLFTQVGRAETLLIGGIIGLLSTLLEAVSARGLDNLLIPVGTFAFLRLYLHATSHALLIRLAATGLLLIFALSWRRRSTLDDSALMASALFGYGAAMLGGPLWLIGPVVLFVAHACFWPRFGPRRDHTVYAVASVILAGLLLLCLQVAYGGKGRFFLPYAVGFGGHLAIIGTSRMAVDVSVRSPTVRLIYSILAGWALALLQMLPLFIHLPHAVSLAGYIILSMILICGVAIAAVSFYVLMPVLYGRHKSDAAIHSAGFTGGLLGSCVAVGLQAAFVSSSL
jgi:phytol kinase